MSSAEASVHQADSGFLRARLGSALAIAPLGVWTVVHLWNNLAAFKGASEWERAVVEYDHPVAFFFSTVLALLPLGLHTVWGIARLTSAKPNNVRYPFFQNVKYLLQRLSAIGLLLFLGAHLWKAMLEPRLELHRPENFADISHQMATHTPTLVVYLLGTLGVAYHLANGVQTFAMGWGLVSSRDALRRLEKVVVLVFLLLLAMGWGAIGALYSAGSAGS
jgi:succinate dehydrogenase / fumarate reductase cytochrome b subunit